MRNSTGGFLLRLLLVIGLAVLVVTVVQGAWLTVISGLLKSNQDAGLPISGTPASAFSFPTNRPSAPIGTELTVGDLAITVTRVLRPADAPIAAAYYKKLDASDEFLAVGIRARCISPDKSCRLTEFDFAVDAERGQEYSAEFTINFSGVRGLFEGGEMAAGQSLSGDLVFVVPRNASGLLLVYPRMYSFDTYAKFMLWP